MTTAAKLLEILDDEAPYADLDIQLYETMVEHDAVERVDRLIETDGWASVYNAFISILLNDKSRYCDWDFIASQLFGAAMDEREVDDDLLIGLVFLRVKPDEGSTENNVAWSLACHLRKESYSRSNYDPRTDTSVIKALRYYGKGLPEERPF